MTHKPSQFLPVIDGFRAIAILSVIITHSAMAWPWTANHPETAKQMEYLLNTLGVPLFFIISGFCIVHGVLNHQKKHGQLQPVSVFLKRRFKRIYPPYFACLLIFLLKVLVVDLWVRGEGISAFTVLKMVFYNLFFLQIIAGDTPHINPAFWSLCVEAQFYILVACILGAINNARWGNQLAMVLILLFSALSILAILGVKSQWIQIGHDIWFMSILRSWPLFLFGGFVAWMLTNDRSKNRDVFLISNVCLIGLALFLAAIDQVGEAVMLSIFWFAMPWPCFGTFTLVGILRSLLSIKPLLFIGQISYSTYLMHGLGIRFIGNKITYLFNDHVLLGMAGAIGLYFFIMVLSYAFFWTVERHWLRSVDRSLPA